MFDPWNMQKEELLEWGRDPDSPWPTEDFDLAIAELHFADVILALAVEVTCPKRKFFLQCAYLIVGDAIRTDFKATSRPDIEQFLVQVKSVGGPELNALYKRAILLISAPSLFDYDRWCDGGSSANE